jgi:thiamine kinase-like enzyme
VLKEYGYDPELGERINEQFGSLLQSDDVSVCHGDFWPGNILLSDTTPYPSSEAKDSEGETTQSEPLKITIVDWEMVRNGNGVSDIGRFSAESFLLDRFRGNKGLLPAFSKAYLEARKEPLTWEEQRRIYADFATHIAYWPTRVPWGTKEETKELMKLGVELLEMLEKGDVEELARGPLKAFFAHT